MNRQTVFDKMKIALVMDHFIPETRMILNQRKLQMLGSFACRHEISNNQYDVGDMGIEHALCQRVKGLVVAGDTVIGADSHACTHRRWELFYPGVGSTWRQEW